MLISISFNQPVKLHSLRLYAPDDGICNFLLLLLSETNVPAIPPNPTTPQTKPPMYNTRITYQTSDIKIYVGVEAQ